MPTPIKYRISSTPEVPTSTTVKGAPLTSAEIDGNFKSLVDSVDAKIDSDDLAAPGGSALVGYKLSQVGAAARTAASKFDDFVYATDFGVMVPNVYDLTTAAANTATINAALDWIRQRKLVTAVARMAVFLPQGKYAVTSVNGTSLNSDWALLGDGTELYGVGEDKATLDLVGSNNGTVRVAISSGATNTPRVGIQIGRAVPAGTLLPGGNPDPAQSAVNMCLDRCTVRGYFKLSALMCVGSEVLEVRNGEYVNRYSGADTYSFILDGIHHWGLQSDYKTVTLPIDAPVGMTQTHIVQATFTRGGNNSVTGPAVWVSRAHGSRWTKCYIGSWSDAPVTIYSKDSGTRCIDLDIDAHIEHTTAPACFLFDGPDTSPTHTRFRYSEQYPQACTSSIFTASASMVKVTLAGFALSLPDTNVTPTDGIFAPASKFTITGDIYFGDTVAVDDPTNTVAFRGYRHVYNRLAHGYGPGSQWILDDTNTDLAFKGEFSVYGTAAAGIAPGQIASTNRIRIQSNQIQMRPVTGGGNVSWNAINPATGTQGASMTYRPADGAYTFGTTTECFSINNLGVMTHTLPPNERVQASHPTSPAPVKGTRYYNSTINKPLWFNGTAWTDAAGTVVP